MADPILEFDPASEGTGTSLVITTGNYGLLTLVAPAPPIKAQWASSVDTEGSLLATAAHENRSITITVDVIGATALADITSKVGKVHREGGTLKYTSPSGTIVVADLLALDGYEPTYDLQHYLGGVTTVSFSLPAKPYLRGTEVELGTDTIETTLPYVVKTVTGPAGDWYAIGRLLVDEDQAVNQWWMTWGLESRYYSSSANAALFYEAEGRTALGGSATAVGPTGASGAGSNVMRNTSLSTDYLAILSTQATGGGAHLSHVGMLHAYARVQVPTANTGLVTVALEWAEADFLAYTRSTATTIPAAHAGQWRYVDLGLVSPSKVLSGTQRWEGRIVAKSTVSGDDIDVDYLILIPAAEGSGIASGVSRSFTPTAYVGEDHFTATTAGVALNARVAPTGGTWATSGDATDFTFVDLAVNGGSGESISRSVGSGTTGRFAILGSTNYTGTFVQTAFSVASSSTPPAEAGVIARWTDASNHLRAVAYANLSTGRLVVEIHELLAGAKTIIGSSSVSGTNNFWTSGTTWTIQLQVDTSGVAVANLIGPPELGRGSVLVTATATRASLASGGTLATGKPGIFDFMSAATGGMLRRYDDFYVATIPGDAAAFASQSVEIRNDRVMREDSGGTMWTRPSSYVGDYLLIPPAGAEGRSVRIIAKMARSNPFTLDPGIDDASMRLFATPRYLTLPA